MFLKQIQLSTHKVGIAFVEPVKELEADTYLIFLHEALGSIGQWRDFPQRLCDALGMRGFVYERRGHGASDALTGERDARYLHDYAYDELPELMQLLIPAGKKVILVGHSDGGTIALLYAAKFPKLVAGIVTMAAHVLSEPETLAGIHPAVEAYRLGKLDGLQKYHGDKTEKLFFAWANTWLSPGFEGWNIEKDIHGIACPALIIQGKDDQYGTPLQVELIVQQMENAEGVILEHCKHHPHLEKGNEAIELIVGRFKGLKVG